MKKLYFLLLLLFLLFLLPVDGTTLSKESSPSKVIIINMTRIDFYDFTNDLYPNLNYLLKNGGFGFIPARVEGRLTPEKFYAAVNSGFATSLLSDSPEFNELLTREKKKLLANGGLNRYQFLWSTQIGLLGSILHKEGKKTALIGNSDLPWKANRSILTLLTDRNGKVDYEVIGPEVLSYDPKFPFGYCTNYLQILAEVQSILVDADLICIDTGDLERLEAYQRFIPDSHLVDLRKLSIQRIDDFVGQIIRQTLFDTTFILFSASPSESRILQEENLLPVIIYKKQGEEGLLYSTSTREKGLLTIGDLTLTIFACLKINQQVKEEVSIAMAGDWKELSKKSEDWYRNLAQRKLILRYYIYFLIGILFVSIILMLMPWNKVTSLIKETLLLASVFPLSLLVIAPFKIENIIVVIVLLILITLLLWLLYLAFYKTKNRAFCGILITTALVILLDLLLGTGIMKKSLLGPNPIVGARFYGLGNEYAGLLLGSLLIGTTYFFTGFRWRGGIGLVMGICSLVIFSPNWGANFGGGVAAVFASVLVCYHNKDKKEARWNLFLLFLLLLFGFSIIFFIPGFQTKTHISNAFQLLSAGRWDLLVMIALRKIRMNIRLINYNILTKLLLVIFVLFFIFLRLAGKQPLFNKLKDEWYWQGISTTVFTGVVALIVNDSGIVMVGTSLLYPLILLFYVLLQGKKKIFIKGSEEGD